MYLGERDEQASQKIMYDRFLKVRWPVRDITIFFLLKLSRDNSNLSRDKMNSYRAINKKIIAR